MNACVYVEDFKSGEGRSVANMFDKRHYKVVYNPDEADFLCFTGGADVMPALYGHSAHPTTNYNAHRDQACMNLFDKYYDLPKVGICRGGQFLNVANGGWMYQHVNNHAISGTHRAVDFMTGEIYEVTSTHHQMMIPSDEAEVLLYAEEATIKECTSLAEDEWYKGLLGTKDAEVLWYEEGQSLCFQPHPEYVDVGHECQELFFLLLEQYCEM